MILMVWLLPFIVPRREENSLWTQSYQKKESIMKTIIIIIIATQIIQTFLRLQSLLLVHQFPGGELRLKSSIMMSQLLQPLRLRPRLRLLNLVLRAALSSIVSLELPLHRPRGKSFTFKMTSLSWIWRWESCSHSSHSSQDSYQLS
jgi:hypothetical protein